MGYMACVFVSLTWGEYGVQVGTRDRIDGFSSDGHSLRGLNSRQSGDMSLVRGLLSEGGWMETVFNIPGVRGRGSLDRRHGGGGQQTSVVLNCTLGMFWPSIGPSFSAKFLTLVSNWSKLILGKILNWGSGLRCWSWAAIPFYFSMNAFPVCTVVITVSFLLHNSPQ